MAVWWLVAAAVAASTPTTPAAEPGEVAFELRDDAGHVNRVLLTPWPGAPADAYVLRYYPGLTFHQGQAPVRPSAAEAPQAPGLGAPALGLGVEGRSPAGHGWQFLMNYAASPLNPAPDPRLVLHGFWLPHHRWGLDADVAVDPRGGVATELGTSLLYGAAEHPDQRLRVAAGRQEGGGLPGYGYAQASLLRDVAAVGMTTGVTLFAGQDGRARGTADAWHAWAAAPALRLATTASLGLADPRLDPGRRMGVGLVTAGAATADGRLAARTEMATPLARGLGWGWGAIATLAQVEGAVFVEGALARGTSDGRDGPRAGAGLQLDLIGDTALGIPLAVGVGVAMPVAGRGGADDVPRVFMATSGPRFDRTPPAGKGSAAEEALPPRLGSRGGGPQLGP